MNFYIIYLPQLKRELRAMKKYGIARRSGMLYKGPALGNLSLVKPGDIPRYESR